MREIKFRGLRKAKNMVGVWAVGNYHKGALTGGSFISGYEVIPETVGQYTGLKDKDGKEIFEGDVIALITADKVAITIICRFGKVQRQIYENLVEITGFYYERSNDGRKTFPIVCNFLGKHDTEIWEVIGNIHDNPELLEAPHDNA